MTAGFCWVVGTMAHLTWANQQVLQGDTHFDVRRMTGNGAWGWTIFRVINVCPGRNENFTRRGPEQYGPEARRIELDRQRKELDNGR